jgi:hypothetical protein
MIQSKIEKYQHHFLLYGEELLIQTVGKPVVEDSPFRVKIQQLLVDCILQYLIIALPVLVVYGTC